MIRKHPYRHLFTDQVAVNGIGIVADSDDRTGRNLDPIRVKSSNPATHGLAQKLHDHFFADMDRCLREMGAGDLGVGKRVKRMAEGLYGRISSYEAALSDDGAAAAALRRNLYGTRPEVSDETIEAMVDYLRRQAAALAEQDTSDLQAGRVSFLPGDA